MKCKNCNNETKANFPVCLSCYPSYINKMPLSCKEKGHRNNLCSCTDKQYPVNPNDFIEQKPGKSVKDFLASVENESDRKKLAAFFAKQR